MDWNITPLAKKSYVSGKFFEEGDRIASFLVRTGEGIVERLDYLASEEDELEESGEGVCRWTHVFKPKPADGKEEAEAVKFTADNLFISLFEGEEDPNPENEKLKLFLALMLERRRVLRVKEKTETETLYVHRPTKNEYSVKAVDLDPEFFMANQEKLDFLTQVPSEEANKGSEPSS
ncbi:hypothetical protein MLD52_10985 [Puniceicoccaceae bacterium K14]|nr:hypothetical protein [Puniceicoccaceae bacterium K14]